MLIEKYSLMIKEALYLTGYFKQTPDVLSTSAVDKKENR
jgi:hypothetical protein